MASRYTAPESLIEHINMVLLREEKKSMMDNKKNKAQKPYTCRNPKWHISLVSLVFCSKIGAAQCFVWHLGLRMWSGSK